MTPALIYIRVTPLLLAAVLAVPSSAQPAPPVDAAAAPATAPSGRSAEQILEDLQALSTELNEAMPDPDSPMDPQKRVQTAPKAMPLLWKIAALGDELIRQKEAAAMAQGLQARRNALMMLTVYGDKEAQDRLLSLANGPDQVEARASRLAYLYARWVAAGDDAEAQAKVVEALDAAVQDQPGDDPGILATVTGMFQHGRPTDENLHRLEQVVLDHLGGSYEIQFLKERIGMARKLRALKGQPLTVTGTTLQGQRFSSEPWKGKVVLVNFWASWGEMSLQDLALLKRLYDEYHDKGLEIVGVSADHSTQDLRKVLDEKKIPWPQLYPHESPGSHPLAAELGVLGLPTTLVIDRAGVVREIALGEDLEKQVRQMFEPPADPAPQNPAQ